MAPDQSPCYPPSNLVDSMKTLVCLNFAGVLRLSALAFVSACCAFDTAVTCQSVPSADPVSASYASEALIIERTETTYKYNEDGTGEKDIFVRVKLQTEAGARQFSVLSFPFTAATEITKPSLSLCIILTEHPPRLPQATAWKCLRPYPSRRLSTPTSSCCRSRCAGCVPATCSSTACVSEAVSIRRQEGSRGRLPRMR